MELMDDPMREPLRRQLENVRRPHCRKPLDNMRAAAPNSFPRVCLRVCVTAAAPHEFSVANDISGEGEEDGSRRVTSADRGRDDSRRGQCWPHLQRILQRPAVKLHAALVFGRQREL